MAAAFAGAQPASIAAVTGTNGKSSTVHFVRHIWASLGLKAASVGTLGIFSPGLTRDAGLTTPDPVQLHEDLAILARQGVTPSRHRGVEPRVGPASSRRAETVGRLLHQPDARASRLSRVDGDLLRGQGAAVRQPAAGKRHGGGQRRQRPRPGPDGDLRAPRHPLLDLRHQGPRIPPAQGPGDVGRPASGGRDPGRAAWHRAAAGRRLPGLQRAGRAGACRGDRRRCRPLGRGAGQRHRRARPPAARRAASHRRQRLCRLRPQARGAGDRAHDACGRSRAAGWSWCSAAAAIAIAPSGR